MPKRNNMGRKSHHVQDQEYKQNLQNDAALNDDMPDQPTRPTLGKTQAVKSSKEEPRDTK